MIIIPLFHMVNTNYDSESGTNYSKPVGQICKMQS